MGIEADDIVTVRDRVNIVDVIGEHVGLRRVGRRWQGLCPFHAEKTPSFSVNAEQGLYYCFGCQAKGDVITFVREVHHLDFVGAVERLAGRAGVTLRYTTHAEGESRRRRHVLHEAVAAAVVWYHERLLTSGDAAPAREYLAARGIDEAAVRRHWLGWAPAGWDHLAKAVDVPEKLFVDAGLGTIHKGRLTDAFRGRIMFPIRDASGNPIGFGARVLPGAEGAKYKNSGDGALYNKSRVVYGLDLAKGPIVERGRVVVCEGYTDVIGLASIGVTEAVATCGTAVTEQHVQLLAAYTRRFVFALDADKAGQDAASKVHQWEQEHGLDIRVAVIPDGTDPGGMAYTDPEGLRAAIDGARPLLGWRLDRLLVDVDDTPEGKAWAVNRALKMIGAHPDRLVRDQYVTAVADRLGLERGQVASGMRRPPKPQPVVVVPERAGGPEVEAIRLLVDRPALTAPLLHPAMFDDPRARAVLEAHEATGETAVSVPALLDRLERPVGEWLCRVTAEGSEADPEDVARLLLRGTVRRWLAEGRVPTDRVAEIKLWVEGLDGDGVAWVQLDSWVRSVGGMDKGVPME